MDVGTPVRIDAAALAQVGASRVLALAPEAWGGTVTLRSGPPKTLLAPMGRIAPASDGSEDLVAVVTIQGPLAQRAQMTLCEAYVDGYDAITARIAEVLQAPNVAAVVLAIDSPGGDVAGLEEAIATIQTLAKQSGKPIYAYADEQMASAAFHIGAAVASSGLYLPASGGIGSVGTLAALVDETKALKAAGIKVEIVRDPPGKAAGHPAEPISDLARERLSALVAGATARFVANVAAARGMSEAAVLETNGAMLYGADAVKAGFADGIDSLAGVVARAKTAGAEWRNQMGMREALASLVRAPASATDVELEQATRAAAPIMDLGRAAMALTGTKSAEEATQTLAMWRSTSEEAAKSAADEAVLRTQRERDERVAIMRSLSVSKRVTPAEAKIDPANDFAVDNIAEPFASMPLGMLRAMGARMTPVVAATVEVVKDDAPGLTSEELHYAKLLKIDPKVLAAHKAAESKERGAA